MSFQFPFHQDARCNDTCFGSARIQSRLSVLFSSGCSLQPLLQIHPTIATLVLSVPFSSGWALQRVSHSSVWLEHSSFSSLFIGMGAAIARLRRRNRLQGRALSVPFSSGWAMQHDFRSTRRPGGPFSSLFIGMEAATAISGCASGLKIPTFSSLFHRDARCNRAIGGAPRER